MRRLFLFLISLALVSWGRIILASDSAAPAVVLRDGLLVVLSGALLFALAARSPEWMQSEGREDASPHPALWRRIGAGTGLLLSLAGGLWLAVTLALTESDGGFLLLPLLLWLGGLGVSVAALHWPQTAAASQTPVAWSVENARSYLQRRLAQGTSRLQGPFYPPRRTVVTALLFLTAMGLLLRVWNFAGLPDGCNPRECENALAAMQFLDTRSLRSLLFTPTPLHTATTALFFALFGPSQQTTLLLGLLMGSLFIPIFFAASVRFVRPATAILGSLLVVFNPHLISLSRHASPVLLLALLLAGVLALRPGAGQGRKAADWVLISLLAGLLLHVAPPPLTWLLFLWFVIMGLLGRQSGAFFYYFLPLVALALPRFAAGLGLEIFSSNSASLFFVQAASLSAQMIQSSGYLSGASGLLAVLGVAYLLRYVRWDHNWVCATGLLLICLPMFATDNPDDLLLLTPLLTFFGIGQVVALDQMLAEFVRTWSTLVPPRRIFVGAAVSLMVLLIASGVPRLRDLAARTEGLDDRHYAAIGAYLYNHFADSVENGGADASLVLVPQAVLNSPAAQLGARGILARSSRILPLDPVAHLPFTGPPFIDQGLEDLVYILPLADHALGRYLSQLYPGMVIQPIQDKRGETQAVAYPVSRGAVANAQGLAALYYQGEETGPLQEAMDVRREGPLEFDWRDTPPLAPPFTLVGKGALYVPQAGSYGFRMQGDSAVDVHLTLGSPLPQPAEVDSPGGVAEMTVELAQGFVSLSLTATSGATGGRFSIQWLRPGAEWETIPRSALYNANLALERGLLAEYYGPPADVDAEQSFADLAASPLLARRVEPWLMAHPLAATAAGAVWRGKIAAPVDGVYTFFASAGGPYQLEIDGILLLTEPTGEPGSTSLLLTQGWHDLVVRYLPRGAEGVRLLWRPPGVAMSLEIGPEFLSPLPADASSESLTLPSLPAVGLPTAQTQNDTSLAQQAAALLQPTADDAPPVDLPDLPFALEWQVGSCGADAEQFLQPRGVALNLYNELVYVADQGNRRVILRDINDGGLVDFYTDERFDEPFDLDVNLLGQVFVLDAVTQTIYRFEEPQGTAVAQPSATSFYRPRGMGIDLNGNFYVADTGGARVVKLGSGDGAVELQLGGPDSLLGQGQPVDVLVPPTGAIFVVTAQDGRLWRMDTGESWSATAPANTFDAPHFAGLPTSAFFLSDPERRQITYFSQNGRPLGQLRSDLFAKPVGVAGLIVGGRDLVLAVSDSATCQVTLWRAPLDALPE